MAHVRRRSPVPGPVLLVLLLAWSTGPALAEHRPLWELGAGLALMSLPDYPGSDEQRGYAIPYPYIVYRGERLRVDRGSVRGLLVDRPRLELDLSVNASLPVNSEDNAARRGMADLDPTVEIGPTLRVHLAGDDDASWRLDLPLRAVVATDLSHFAHEGWIFNPRLEHLRRLSGGERPWRVRIAAGPQFATERYHEYFYGVPPDAATTARPAFAADGGYGGFRVTATFARRLTADLLLGGFVRYDNLRGTAFDESPLLRTEDAFMAGVALTWVFKRSNERVSHRE